MAAVHPLVKRETDSKTPVIVGIAVGVVALNAILMLGWFIVRRRRSAESDEHPILQTGVERKLSVHSQHSRASRKVSFAPPPAYPSLSYYQTIVDVNAQRYGAAVTPMSYHHASQSVVPIRGDTSDAYFEKRDIGSSPPRPIIHVPSLDSVSMYSSPTPPPQAAVRDVRPPPRSPTEVSSVSEIAAAHSGYIWPKRWSQSIVGTETLEAKLSVAPASSSKVRWQVRPGNDDTASQISSSAGTPSESPPTSSPPPAVVSRSLFLNRSPLAGASRPSLASTSSASWRLSNGSALSKQSSNKDDITCVVEEDEDTVQGDRR
ncbi:hypothetical protein HGRIS_002503 [Hohenbuehelia grisea]|uniref:Uncharacterized protein n=1 Tax=Hohenbuehelia grisea TaxID=104357 RepID=A0ABR3JLT7_9AGAR